MLESDAVIEQAARLRAEGKPFALATVVRSEAHTSAKPGAKAVVEPDGTIHGWVGGGCAQPAVTKTARQALEDGEPRLIRISPTKGAMQEEGVIDFGMTCHSGGTLDVFIDPVIPRPALLIVGAAPAARTLAALAKRMGFFVTAANPGATPEDFPDADHVVDGLDLQSMPGPRPSFVVVATQGKRDEGGLEAALKTRAPYVAFIASSRKAEKLKQYLAERGHEAAQVEAIVAPAGVDIGAVTPEEIALSVLAGIVQARRGASAVQVAVARAAAVPQASAATVDRVDEATDPVCGMRVEIAGAEFSSEYAGSVYYFCCGGCLHTFNKNPSKYLASAT
ncbi:MAG: XdhC family protein [Gammaproteobacteria bacterium]|nr:XdhC family protein [Gammaproteobacteria bacterium]MDJ0871348.1 XdhC family protein [Gammaproteobacteria bacterium]